MYSPYHKSNIVPEFWKKKYEKEAKKFWNKFYLNNTTNFFKDRHWLTREFPFLAPTESTLQKTLLEVGCGVGNSVFPLIDENPNLFIYACDFSQQAIKLIKDSLKFNPQKICPFVCDVCSDTLTDFVKEDSVDYVLLIFVLSAMSPDQMRIVLKKLHTVLKPDGKLLFRDYAVGDMAQLRFEEEEPNKEANKLEDNFYVRGDGTRAYYFSKDMLTELLVSAGFEVEQNEFVNKVVTNVKESKEMHRVWIQAVASKKEEEKQQT